MNECFMPKTPTRFNSVHTISSVSTCCIAWSPVFRVHDEDCFSASPENQRYFRVQRSRVGLTPMSESKSRKCRKQEQKLPPQLFYVWNDPDSYHLQSLGEWIPQSSFLNLENLQEKNYWGKGTMSCTQHPPGTWRLGSNTGLCVGGEYIGGVWGGKAGW